MTGHQIWGLDSIGNLTKTNPTTMQLSASIVTIGGLQYDTITLALDLATAIDVGAVASDSLYYVYVVNDSGSLVLKYSLSGVSPVGFSLNKKVGSFRTNSLSQIAGTSVKDQGRVGDIIQSMLTEEQFIAENGAGWVLADGRSVSGTKYATLIGASIPDMRGQFLRGKNNSREDGEENPDGDLALGTYSADKFASHNHPIRVRAGTTLDNGGSNVPYSGPGGTDGGIISNVGGNETAPKNVTVNFFIKVEDIAI